MRRLLILLIPVLLLLACKRDPLPKNAIAHEKFVDVLVDVHLAEAIHRDRFRLRADSFHTTSLYLSVLDKHGITEEQMLVTTLYYSRNPKEYDKVYAEVLSKVSMMLEDENKPVEMTVNPE